MTIRKTIQNLNFEIQNATRMGCTYEYIEMLKNSLKAMYSVEKIDDIIQKHEKDTYGQAYHPQEVIENIKEAIKWLK